MTGEEGEAEGVRDGDADKDGVGDGTGDSEGSWNTPPFGMIGGGTRQVTRCDRTCSAGYLDAWVEP